MHERVREAFREALTKSLPIAQKLANESVEPHLVWRKTGDQQWNGRFEQHPSLLPMHVRRQSEFQQIGSDLVEVFKTDVPECGGIVGSPSFGCVRILDDPTHIVGSALFTLWQRHHSFMVPPTAIEAIVQEFVEFIEQPTTRIRFLAQLLNFRMPVDNIDFPEGLRIRRLSEEEVSDLYGGSVFRPTLTANRGIGIHEFAIGGEFAEPRIFVDQAVGPSLGYNEVYPKLDKAILAIRTFKEGHVGYDRVHFQATSFCLLQLATFGRGDLYVPFGVYTLETEELERLRQHAQLVFRCIEPAMEMACSRLSDAQTRIRPQDRLVDAVIGLEALLLAGHDKEYRGELRYRFSLNYSTLFEKPAERHRAFRVAKDLYDLRSTIAHGGILKKENCRVGEEKLTADDAAKRACEVLQNVIRHFLPQTDAAPYKKPDFWERAYFGLPAQV
jgi:hypothetical protein